MVVAMRLLLRAALADVRTQRFMYACEHTLPLYPPTLVYQQLMGESKSRINACPEREKTNDVSLLILNLQNMLNMKRPTYSCRLTCQHSLS